MAAPAKGGSAGGAWPDALGIIVPLAVLPVFLGVAVVSGIAEDRRKPPQIPTQRQALQAYLAGRASGDQSMAAFYANREARGWGKRR